MPIKELLSVFAIALTLFAFIPYIRAIRAGITRPHVFSWIIWGSTTFVVFLAQLADGGGAGAWPIGISGLITLYVATLAYRHQSDTTITRTDWVFLLAAATSLPLWYLTNDPLWAVVILTTVDMLGFGPTFHKAYHLPHEENLLFYSLMAGRNMTVMLALEHYSLTTLLFPAATGVGSLLLIGLIVLRRNIGQPNG